MLDFNKIKNTKKDRLIIAINMAKIFYGREFLKGINE